MTQRPRKLGIAAGGGVLPLMLAEAARTQGREVFIVGVKGAAGPSIEAWPHAWVRVGAMGRFARLFKQAACEDIAIIGTMIRPRLRDIVPDFQGALLLPDFMKRLKIGDDALLRGVVEFLEKNGFNIIPAESILTSILARKGLMTRLAPDAAHETDIDIAIRAALELGAQDIGQGVVVREGAVIEREDIKGTDAMLIRVANEYPTASTRRSGVLVKLPKPAQDRRVDLPTIGSHTVELAAAAGLAGIAVEAGGVIVADREKLVALADKLGLFILGFPSPNVGTST